MKCSTCEFHFDNQMQEEIQEATVKIWCPTWVFAYNGPKVFCEEHSKNFIEEHNPNAEGGQFFFNKDADAAYASVEVFIPSEDDNFGDAYSMLENGRIVSGKPRSPLSGFVSVVNGKVWVANTTLVACLGDYDDIVTRMPKLFKPQNV